MDNTEYVESEYENISCFDAPQGMALHRPYTSGQRNVVYGKGRTQNVQDPSRNQERFSSRSKRFFRTFPYMVGVRGLPRDDEGLISLLLSVNKYCITRSTQDYAY